MTTPDPVEQQWRVVEWDTPFPPIYEIWFGDVRLGVTCGDRETAEDMAAALNKTGIAQDRQRYRDALVAIRDELKCIHEYNSVTARKLAQKALEEGT